jgi:hypothetical protein
MNIKLLVLILAVVFVASAPLVSASNWDRMDEDHEPASESEKNVSGHPDNIKRHDQTKKKVCGIKLC